MDSFFKSGLLVILLIVGSIILLKIIEAFFPLLELVWYFGLGIILGVLGVFFIQEKYKKYEEDEKKNGTY